MSIKINFPLRILPTCELHRKLSTSAADISEHGGHICHNYRKQQRKYSSRGGCYQLHDMSIRAQFPRQCNVDVVCLRCLQTRSSELRALIALCFKQVVRFLINPLAKDKFSLRKDELHLELCSRMCRDQFHGDVKLARGWIATWDLRKSIPNACKFKYVSETRQNGVHQTHRNICENGQAVSRCLNIGQHAQVF